MLKYYTSKLKNLWDEHRCWKGFTKHLPANPRLPGSASVPVSDISRERWRQNAHLPLHTSVTDPKNRNILFCSRGTIIEIRKLKVYVPVSSNFSSCSHVLWRGRQSWSLSHIGLSCPFGLEQFPWLWSSVPGQANYFIEGPSVWICFTVLIQGARFP